MSSFRVKDSQSYPVVIGTRIGSVAPYASVEREEKREESAADDAPASETRAVGGPLAGPLRVFMCLRAQDAQRAWLSIADEAGALLFEGWLSVDDGVQAELGQLSAGTLVRLSLETERWHRQAYVTLGEGLTEHVFV